MFKLITIVPESPHPRCLSFFFFAKIWCIDIKLASYKTDLFFLNLHTIKFVSYKLSTYVKIKINHTKILIICDSVVLFPRYPHGKVSHQMVRHKLARGTYLSTKLAPNHAKTTTTGYDIIGSWSWTSCRWISFWGF